MHLKKIHLHNYKNHAQKGFDFCVGFNCLVGKNGVGKTNVLDSIYYLCYTKSYFTKQESSVVHDSQQQFAITGRFLQGDEESKVIVGNHVGVKKTVVKNELKYKVLSDYIGFVNSVFITPTDILLIYEGADSRRKFINTMIASYDSNYLKSLMKYKSVLDKKNKVLKNGDNIPINRDLIESYNVLLSSLGIDLYKSRREFLMDFRKEFKEIYTSFGGLNESVFIDYVSDLDVDEQESLLSNCIENDIQARRSTKGVHRDDLKFFINDKPLKSHGSQGQIKSFLIALKLAQFSMIKERTGVAPILLLDDIFEKIDEERTNKLLSFVNKAGFNQVFVTDAHPERCHHFLEMLDGEKRIFNLDE